MKSRKTSKGARRTSLSPIGHASLLPRDDGELTPVRSLLMGSLTEQQSQAHQDSKFPAFAALLKDHPPSGLDDDAETCLSGSMVHGMAHETVGEDRSESLDAVEGTSYGTSLPDAPSSVFRSEPSESTLAPKPQTPQLWPSKDRQLLSSPPSPPYSSSFTSTLVSTGNTSDNSITGALMQAPINIENETVCDLFETYLHGEMEKYSRFNLAYQCELEKMRKAPAFAMEKEKDGGNLLTTYKTTVSGLLRGFFSKYKSLQGAKLGVVDGCVVASNGKVYKLLEETGARRFKVRTISDPELRLLASLTTSLC